MLPLWLTKLKELGLDIWMMPCDVPTCWNSTFNMLNFAIKYCAAIDTVTSNHDINLRKYELEDDKWIIAKNLCDTLKVWILFFILSLPLSSSDVLDSLF